MALDSQENVYVTDEWLNRVSIFDQEGNFLRDWGTAGSDDGEFNGPSGIAIDRQDVLYIVDSRNHRVQKFTKDGRFLSSWGSLGSGQGSSTPPGASPWTSKGTCTWPIIRTTACRSSPRRGNS